MGSLVYHAGALGDFITTLPAMRVWRRLHPAERITLLGKPRLASVAGRFASWDEVWDVESPRLARLFRPEQPDPLGTTALESAMEPVDLSCFSSALLFSPPSSPLRANLHALGVRGIQWQAPFPSSAMPIIDYHLSMFPSLEISEDERIPLVDPGELPQLSRSSASATTERTVDTRGPTVATPGPTVALHPGSGSPAKNWPLARFRELAAELEREGQRVAWIAGPAEEGLSLEGDGAVWRELPLANLCAKLARCRLYVGNDSGVTHLAAAAGVPTLALFGASDPRIWAPKGRRVRTLCAAKPPEIPLSAVLEDCRVLIGG